MKRWKVIGVNFDHFHMTDNLAMASQHPDVDIVGICDTRPERLRAAQTQFQLPDRSVFTDYQACLASTAPDIVLLCPAAAKHGIWTERIAPCGAHLIIEKPFAASLAEADRMVNAVAGLGQLVINWPMTWYPTNRTAYRLIREGCIGTVCEVHYYDGNRGPLWHTSGKEERTAEQVAAEKADSWFYSANHGGGSLQDYMGYGTTLATWFNGGKVPVEVTAVVDEPKGLNVDEHAIAIARYDVGLSKFETRWGTFSDPWTHQPQPQCGFVIVGTEGTISCYDYQETLVVQTRECPEGQVVAVDAVTAPFQNPVQYLIHCLESGSPIEGPSSIAISRIGQQIVDAAMLSARQKRTVTL